MTNKTKNVITLILTSAFLIIIGYLGSINSKEYYSSLILPSFSPPSVVFPIAWGIIYTLMIIAAVIIEAYAFNTPLKKDALSFYWVQLVINVIWPWLFFVFKLNFVSFLWIILLFVVVFLTFRKFYKINKLAGYLYIPYLLWLIYAAYINLGVAVLN